MSAVELRVGLAMTVVVTLLFVATGLHFAALQNVWIDEATQLSGITLAAGDLLAWLAGSPVPEFGVPPDRMPPLSYMIDWVCARTLCGGETDFRWLHLAITASGVALIVGLAAARYGWQAGAVTGTFLLLSPKLTELAVEVRAYPIFFAVTCAQIWQLYRLMDQPRLRVGSLIAFLLLGIGAVYTHFFGLVSSMALLTGLLAGRVTDRRDAALIIAGAVALLLCSAGLAPFVAGANSISGVERSGLTTVELAEFGLKLFGHPANLLSNAAASLFFGGLTALLLISLRRIVAELRRDPLATLRQPLGALAVAVALGLTVTLIAALIIRGFNPLKITYSIWTLPMLALLVGAPLARPVFSEHGATERRLVQAAAVLFAGGAAWSQSAFISNARWFVHGPGEVIAAELVRAPGASSVVYRGDWEFGFFPIYYLHRKNVPQWLMDGNGQVHSLDHAVVAEQGLDPLDALRGRRIILVDIQTESYLTLRRLYRGAPPAIVVAAEPIPNLRGWQPTADRTEPGLYWTRLTRFEPLESRWQPRN